MQRASFGGSLRALAGSGNRGEGREIRKVDFLENKDHAEDHFTLWIPGDQINAIRDMRANGLKPLGNWHSHPSSPSRPSVEDIRLAFDSKASYPDPCH
ncbi:MAG: Mov34/MPN/PAD-1 family protein [Blautia wexlerae]